MIYLWKATGGGKKITKFTSQPLTNYKLHNFFWGGGVFGDKIWNITKVVHEKFQSWRGAGGVC